MPQVQTVPQQQSLFPSSDIQHHSAQNSTMQPEINKGHQQTTISDFNPNSIIPTRATLKNGKKGQLNLQMNGSPGNQWETQYENHASDMQWRGNYKGPYTDKTQTKNRTEANQSYTAHGSPLFYNDTAAQGLDGNRRSEKKTEKSFLYQAWSRRGRI